MEAPASSSTAAPDSAAPESAAAGAGSTAAPPTGTAGRTASIHKLLADLGDRPVGAGEVVDALLRAPAHSSYAGGRGPSWSVPWPPARVRRPVRQWLERCEELRNPRDHAPLSGRLVILLLALVDPAAGRAMLRSGLVAALLEEYGPIDGSAAAPLARVLGPAAVRRGAAVPLLATAYGLADQTTVERPVPSGTTPVAVGWDGDTPLAITDDGAVLELGGRGRTAATGISAPTEVWVRHGRVFAASPTASASVRWGADTPTRSATGPVATPPAIRSARGDAALLVAPDDPSRAVAGAGDPADPAWGDTAWTVPAVESSTSPPAAWAVSDDARTVVRVLPEGTVVWTDRSSASASVGTGVRPWMLSADGDAATVAVLTQDAVTVVARPGRDGPGGVLLAVRRRDDPVLQHACLSPDGSRLAMLHWLQPNAFLVDVHDLRLSPSRRRAAFDSDVAFDTDGGTDYADLDADVEALAMLVASRSLTPPLSLGLFGDWGAGKTFFLNRLRARVLALSRSARDSGRPQAEVEFWKHVVAVDFNAWTFADANLWASLMERILSALRRRPAAPVAGRGSEPLVGASLLDESVARAQAEERHQADVLRAAQRAADRARLVAGGWAALAVTGVLLVVTGLATATPPAWGTGIAAALAAVGAYLAELRRLSRTASETAQAAGPGFQPFTGWWRLETERREAVAAHAEATARAERAARIQSDPRLVVGAYIEQRLASGDYRRHLGVVNLVRTDLTEMDRAVQAANEAVVRDGGPDVPAGGTEPAGAERGDGPGGAGGDGNRDDVVNRVVVFIDDLDRCPPRRVVEVLEAVHLLLAFRLFVVVLAVDSRWLQQSLRAHYQGLLGGEDDGAAAPLDYVEKIVQLPVQVHPMTAAAVQRMLTGLAGADLPEEAAGQTSGAAPAAAPGAPPPGAPERPTVPDQRRPAATGAPAPGPAAATAPAAPAVDLAPQGLLITPAEAAALADLAPLLGSTPRTVKRFINTYRVLKSRTDDPDAFTEDVGAQSEYRVVGLLLAVVVGMEALAPHLFAALGRAGDDDTLRTLLRSCPGGPSAAGRQRATLMEWLHEHDLSDAPARPYAEQAPVAARYSFAALLPPP